MATSSKNHINHKYSVLYRRDDTIRSYEFNLSKLNIQPEGLFEAVLASLSHPLSASCFNMFKNVLNLLKDNDRAVGILSLPLNEIESVDIRTLFILTEAIIQTKLVDTGRYKAGYRPSFSFRRVMKYLHTSLSDGSTIEDVKFKTRFNDTKGRREIISEQYDKGCDNPEQADPISHLRGSTEIELHDKALSHLEARNQRIEEACYNVLNTYVDIRSHLKQLENTKLPKQLENTLKDYTLSKKCTINQLNNLTSDSLLHFYICYFKTHGLYSISEFKLWFKDLTNIPFEKKIFEHKYVNQLGLINKKQFNIDYPTIVVSLILARKIMPSLIVLCIRNLFQLQFKWNVGTCNSISLDMISRTNDGYHITALKTKTSQEFSEKIFENILYDQDKNLVNVIEILIKNNTNIHNNWEYETNSIFIGISNNKKFPIAHKLNFSVLIERFISLYDLPKFTPEQLRDQALNTHYLKTKDIHSLQAVAGWSTLATASNYLDQTINRILSEANIYNYMVRLESSIIWATKGIKGLKKFGIDPTSVDKKLLFPINTKNADSDSILDQWLVNDKTIIIINNDRMKHTLRQTRYYKKYWLELLSENEGRFLITHLHRILMCFALDKVIRNSEHAKEYMEMENN